MVQIWIPARFLSEYRTLDAITYRWKLEMGLFGMSEKLPDAIYVVVSIVIIWLAAFRHNAWRLIENPH